MARIVHDRNTVENNFYFVRTMCCLFISLNRLYIKAKLQNQLRVSIGWFGNRVPYNLSRVNKRSKHKVYRFTLA